MAPRAGADWQDIIEYILRYLYARKMQLTLCVSMRWQPMPRPSSSSAIRAVPAAMSAAYWAEPAAMHFVNGKNGVKDFDALSFYAQLDDWPFPGRWRGTRDFGPSKFSRYSDDPPQYVGRRVGLLGRSLRAASGTDSAHSIHDYLAAGWTTSAWALAGEQRS